MKTKILIPSTSADRQNKPTKAENREQKNRNQRKMKVSGSSVKQIRDIQTKKN